MSWITDIFSPQERSWEDFYRNRWAFDKVVRSTHGVNCTGSCSWNVHVKQGIVTWETQALDYPRFDKNIPPYEPRGCQRGISYSWYIYSPLRVKYPLVRGVLFDLWKEAKKKHPDDLIEAWKSIVENPIQRQKYHEARGKGGFRRASWDEVLEIMSVANIYTVKRYGPDRLAGFSPIPAMSMISYAGGARFMQLMGGISLSFYDWYCDLPPASPEIWGEQTDVAESADWYKSKMIAVVGSNVFMTRTPDAHFLVEARHHGTKVVVFSPDFSQVCKAADEWIPLHQGQDGAFWMSVGHVILKEYYIDKQIPYFIDYLKKYSDAPFLVKLDQLQNGHFKSGELLRLSDLESSAKAENAEWKFFVQHTADGSLKVPMGTMGHRWQKEKGQWNLKLEDAFTHEPIDPSLRLGEHGVKKVAVEFADFSDGTNDKVSLREVPVRKIETVNGPVWVTTGFELLLAQYGVFHGQSEGWPADYGDEKGVYTPAWQEKFTGVSGKLVISFARQWAETAAKSEGKCSVIIGAGVNHWYHNNLIYRSAIMALIFCGCVGKNGGGLNHYVGQEKLVPVASWAPIAFGTDWNGPPRLQNAPSFHYIHTDQWRYDNAIQQVCPVSSINHPMTHGHTADKQALAVRCGWLPCFPQFNKSNFELVREAKLQGAKTPEEIQTYVVKELKSRRLRFAMEDPDNPESFPRVWYIWRGNALLSSAKGHEYFLKHYLGTHHNSIAEENAKNKTEDVVWHEKMPVGKMDLVVDLNFRMDTSALYSDIVLPAATFYEKNDLSSTDMHSFIHPLQAAVPPAWESKSDWAAFKEIAKKTSEVAKKYFPEPQQDIVVTPLMHDSPAEIAQRSIKDWAKGECEAIPGKTMPNIAIVNRSYGDVYQKFISLGPNFRDKGIGGHGLIYPVADFYDDYVTKNPVEQWNGKVYPSLKDDKAVCEVILAFAAETNGEMAFRAYEIESHKVGRDLTHLAKDTRAVRYNFQDIAANPRRILTTPFWTGNVNNGRTYSAFCQNTDELIPWRTLTGRQHLYLDHEAYRAYGEELPTYKPRLDMRVTQDLDLTEQKPGTIVLNYITPHGKWHIHSTFSDNLIMKTLSRGIEPVWINDSDAAKAGIHDNDWVEVINDHGVLVTRAVVSARISKGMCLIYHAVERTVGVPKSPSRNNRRAGGHNSLTRVRLKPLFMVGGYGQFSYGFNYWGPQGVNRDTFVLIRRLNEVNW